MASRRLFVLGPPRLEQAGRPVELHLRRALALLVYLAVTRQPQSRDALAALLWPDSDDREARASLRRTLHRLTQALGEDLLRGEGDLLRLAPEAELWVDSAAFEQHAAKGLASEPTGESPSESSSENPDRPRRPDPERLAHLTEAARLYRDDFLAGFNLPDSPAWEEWQFFQREGLRQTYARVLERLVEAHRAEQAWEVALGYARRWLGLDPLHEPAHRALMQLYASAGQQAAALRQYQECVRLLEVELGVAPEDATTELYQAIRAKRLAPPPRVEAGAVAGTVSAPISPSPLQRPGAPAQAARPSDRSQVRPASEVSALEQEIRFCKAPDGVRLAYAIVGQGPPLVKAPNWLSHLEFEWQSPVWRHWLAGLARHHTLVRYDARGCGLSDWDVEEFSLNASVQDLETVIEALGLDRFPLLGISAGGPVAVTYAVRHPEKVSHLILYGAFARGWFERTYAPRKIIKANLLTQLIEVGWGQDNPAFRQVFTGMFIPDATLDQIHWFNDLQRISTSSHNAVRMWSMFGHLNVQDEASRVAVPTLVLHPRDDAVVPFEEGRHLAALIPGARFIALDSKNHILLETEPAWQRFLSEVHRFLQV